MPGVTHKRWLSPFSQGAADVQIAQTLDAPQFDIDVDRPRAKLLGINQEDIAKNMLTTLGSSIGYASTIWVDPTSGIDFFMGVQYENNEVDSFDELLNIPLSLHSKCRLHVADRYGFGETLQGITSRNELLCHETIKTACDDGLGDWGVIQLL